MGFGLGILRLSPKQFWLMTPRELNAAFVAVTKQHGGMPPLKRKELEQLMDKFPDKEPEQ